MSSAKSKTQPFSESSTLRTGNDQMGDRMKSYEAHETARSFIPLLPIYARIDGRGFSRFTKGLVRPFDPRMTQAMIDTTKYLVEQTHAKIGYTQSDEISLMWYSDDYSKEVMFRGKVQKLVSVLASMTAARFIFELRKQFTLDEYERYAARIPHFDCRVYQLPNLVEASNAILWRAMDCQKNAVSMAAHHEFSHKALQGKNQGQMLALLADKGVDFQAYPAAFRLGTFVRRELVEKNLSEAELERIPKHKRPTEPVLRSIMNEVSMEAFKTVSNRVGVIFNSQSPTYEGQNV